MLVAVWKMIRSTFLALFILSAVSFTAPAQTGTPDDQSQQQLLALIKDVQAQQAQIADNQAKIDEKLAVLTEAIRQARLYSSRAGH